MSYESSSIVEDMKERHDALALLMSRQAGMEHVEFTDRQIRGVRRVLNG